MSQKTLETILSEAQSGSLQAKCQLLSYGKSKGFSSSINRKLIWPFLLGINRSQIGENIYDWADPSDRNCRDYDQIERDAERSLGNMKIFKDISKFHLQKRQKDILNILNHFFYKKKHLRYTQGFHDVASIFLILFGNSMGYCMLEKAAQYYFQDSLTKELGLMNSALSGIILEILCKQDKSFGKMFACFQRIGMISFTIPWILTWFSHDFDSMKTICRIWDYLLCSGPHGIIYLTTAIILSVKQGLKQFKQQHDLASIQAYFQKITSNQSIDIQQAISLAINLEDSYQISTLKSYEKIQEDSIFNTELFEYNIDLHRQVREYVKIQKKRKIFVGKVLLATGAVLAGLLLVQRYRKKFG